MKRVFTTLALLGAFAAPAFAAGEGGPSCSDYMAMDSSDQMKAVEQMASAMPEGDMPKDQMGDQSTSMSEMGSSGSSGGTLGGDMLMKNAQKACDAHPDGTVTDALGMMSGN